MKNKYQSFSSRTNTQTFKDTCTLYSINRPACMLYGHEKVFLCKSHVLCIVYRPIKNTFTLSHAYHKLHYLYRKMKRFNTTHDIDIILENRDSSKFMVKRKFGINCMFHNNFMDLCISTPYRLTDNKMKIESREFRNFSNVDKRFTLEKYYFVVFAIKPYHEGRMHGQLLLFAFVVFRFYQF